MILASANQKGGVLKTTSAQNIGVGLCLRGKKVLLVDIDPQASLTIAMGYEPEGYKRNVCSLMMEEPAGFCIHRGDEKRPDLIPGSIQLAALEMQLTSRMARENILSRALRDVKDSYDFVIIDCPPQLSILTINALAAADQVIIPCKTDYLSYRGLDMLKETIRDIKELTNPELKIMGIIATLYEKRVTDHKEVLKAMEEKEHVVGIVKKTAAATKGIYDGEAVITYRPDAEVASQYRKIVDHIIQEVA